MAFTEIENRDLSSEFNFSASRSSGAGGQNVNKVNTKVELRFNVINSKLLTEEEKMTILHKLAGKINLKGELIVVSQDERSQLQNKENTIKKFNHLITKALTPVKKRKKTKPSRAAKEKRMEGKRINSEKKSYRKRVTF